MSLKIGNALVIFSNKKIDLLDSCKVFSSWDSFLESKIDPLGFFIASDFSDVHIDIVKYIRSSKWWYKFCFSEEDIGNQLLDGQVNLVQAIDRCKLAEEKLKKLTFSLDTLASSEKLLVYLFLRDNFEIFPEFKPDAKMLYTYPIIECLSEDKNDIDWYKELIRRNVLKYNKLVDRVRLCNKCSSAHIYFVDVCPNCKSLDIKRTRMIHCFECGYIGSQEEFSKGYDQICPKCSAHLKHIGVDYDLPTAQYSCNNCGFIFDEPETIYRCITCGEQGNPDRLMVQEFYSIIMTLYGHEWLLLEQKKIVFSILNESFKYVSLEYFQLVLSWFIKLYRRDNNFAFALLLLKLQNIEEIIEYYGISKSLDIYRELAKRISEILRNTDIVCRDDKYKLWIFMPATYKKGVCKRISETLESIQPNNDVKIKLLTNVIYSSELIDESNAETLMKQLDLRND